MIPVLKRILRALVTIYLVASLIFIVVNIMPGDIVSEIAHQIASDLRIPFEQAYEMAAALYGKPEAGFENYLKYISSLFLKGDLGYSYSFRRSINEIILGALPWTIFILSISLLISFALGSIIGLIAAWRRKGLIDISVTTFSIITQSFPSILIALILFMIFSVELGLFPRGGAYDPRVTPGFNIGFIASVFYHAALPILSLVIEGLGGWILIMRNSAISVLGEDYVYAAQARGLRERRIFFTYVGRNSILPPVTILALSFGGVIGGSVLIESIFRYPGIGYFFVQAISRRDYPLMQGLFFMMALGIIVSNLIVDLIYPKLDPRVKTQNA